MGWSMEVASAYFVAIILRVSIQLIITRKNSFKRQRRVRVKLLFSKRSDLQSVGGSPSVGRSLTEESM